VILLWYTALRQKPILSEDLKHGSGVPQESGKRTAKTQAKTARGHRPGLSEWTTNI
jgi:hypothetical protein